MHPFGISPSVDSGTGVDMPIGETGVEPVSWLAVKGSMGEIEDVGGSGEGFWDTNLWCFRVSAGEVLTIVLRFWEIAVGIGEAGTIGTEMREGKISGGRGKGTGVYGRAARLDLDSLWEEAEGFAGIASSEICGPFP